MSAAQSVYFGNIKYCIICGKTAVVQEGAISCCSKFILSEKDECGALLSSYARDGLMKFCYMCGNDMAVAKNITFCENCEDTLNFDVPPKILQIQLSDIQYCPLCANQVCHDDNKTVICQRGCTFRIVLKETQSAMSRLTEYATKGKVRYCYSCGSETKSETLPVVCSKNNCGSILGPRKSQLYFALVLAK